MNYPLARTATSALRLAKTEEKAQAILREGYLLEETVEGSRDIIAIFKPCGLGVKFAYLIVDNGKKRECGCPDFQNHKDYCKHILALNYLEEEQAQCEEYEKRMTICEDEVHGCDRYARY